MVSVTGGWVGQLPLFLFLLTGVVVVVYTGATIHRVQQVHRWGPDTTFFSVLLVKRSGQSDSASFLCLTCDVCLNWYAAEDNESVETGTINEYLKFFIALLAIVNPMGMLPVFINMTAHQTAEVRRKNSVMAAVSMGIILLVVLFSGEAILRFFGISVDSFRVGGGILILLMAISMLNAKMGNVRQTKEEELDSAERDNVAVVPLGTPLLAGPGAISTVILYAQRYPSPLHYIYLMVAIVLLACLIACLFRLAPAITRLFGKTGINIVTRLMGLIMAAMGVEFIASGLRHLFPVLAG
jgi:multiple antibiotic resistance protein